MAIENFTYLVLGGVRGRFFPEEEAALEVPDSNGGYPSVEAATKPRPNNARSSDRSCTAPQMPISTPRYRVLYLKERKEHRTAWFYREAHARRALEIMKRRYGEKNAVIYVD